MFQPPIHCPSCGSDLVWQKDQLFCRSSTCPAQNSKKVEHFAKTLKIKGLGPAAIEKLGLESLSDIYNANLSLLQSEKIAEKLSAEIEKSKRHSFNNVLPALGIPNIGKSATQKLATVCNSIFDIDEESCKKAGLGPKTTNNLLDDLVINLDEYLELPFTFEFESVETSNDKKGVICITGKLKSFKTKSDAAKALESQGWQVVSSVTKATTHLVNESGVETAKTKKAADSGIIIVNNLTELMEII